MRKERESMLWFFFFVVCFSHLFGKEIEPFGPMGDVFVIVDKAPLYDEPDFNSRLIWKLEMLERVYISKKTNMSKNGVQEEWFYVDSKILTNSRRGIPSIKGWIERKYLVGRGDFEEVKEMKEMFISVVYQEYGVEYHIRPDGFFTCSFGEEENRLHRGRIYWCKVNTNFFSFEHGEFFWYSNNEVKVPSIFVYEVMVYTNKFEFALWASADISQVVAGGYAHLTGDNVNIRANPTTNSVVLTRLRKGARVKVLEISEEVFRLGDREGLWVYVETEEKDRNGKPIRGWMVDIYLKPEE